MPTEIQRDQVCYLRLVRRLKEIVSGIVVTGDGLLIVLNIDY